MPDQPNDTNQEESAPETAQVAEKPRPKIGLILLIASAFLLLIGGPVAAAIGQAAINPENREPSVASSGAVGSGGCYLENDAFINTAPLNFEENLQKLINKYTEFLKKNATVVVKQENGKDVTTIDMIKSKASDAGINPAILISFWAGEQSFGNLDYAMGCHGSSSFEEQVGCALDAIKAAINKDPDYPSKGENRYNKLPDPATHTWNRLVYNYVADPNRKSVWENSHYVTSASNPRIIILRQLVPDDVVCEASSTSGRDGIVQKAKDELDAWNAKKIDASRYNGGNGEDWCADFVNYVYNAAGLPLNKANHSSLGMEQSFSKQAWRPASSLVGASDLTRVLRPGDVYVVDKSNGRGHTGIIIEVNTDNFVTIEGNAGGGNVKKEPPYKGFSDLENKQGGTLLGIGRWITAAPTPAPASE